MSPGNRKKRGNRGSARGGHSDKPNPNKAARHSGDKPTPHTTVNEPASKQATNESLKSPTPTPTPTPTPNVHPVDEEEDVTAAICWICAEPVRYYSLAACNHRTCHVCALRLRVLYGKLECTFCKEPQSTVIFTTSPDADFLSYTPDAIPYKDGKLAIFFETEDMKEETHILLRFNCPGLECDYTASGWGDLKLHTRAVHGKAFCDLCIRFKKVFAHEHALYPPNVLPLHLPSIPHRPRKQPLKETVEGGIHPLCEFCNECFFGDDELFVHMREQHEECFLCKRNEVRDQYFQNYDSLELHFLRTHFACTEPICQAEKFVVFDSELDLNAHRLEVHGADMSSKDKKEARRVPIESGFNDTGSSSRRGESMAQIAQTQGSVAGRPREMAEESFMTESTRTIQCSEPSGRAASIKTAMPEYRTNESSAYDLISTVWNVLDQNIHDTASIINAVVDFLEEEEKKYDLLAAWNEFEIDSEQRQQSFDVVPTATRSDYAGITNGYIPNADSQRSPRLEHHVAQTASPSSPIIPGVSVSAFTHSGTTQLETFPSFIRSSTNANLTHGSHQPQQPKSWASVAALPLSSATTPKKTDMARQPLTLSAVQRQRSPSSAGPSTGANMAPGSYYHYPSQPSQTWASLASTDLSAWTPDWNVHEGESSAAISTGMGMWASLEPPMSQRSETTMIGQGKKGKGKQRQRVI